MKKRIFAMALAVMTLFGAVGCNIAPSSEDSAKDSNTPTAVRPVTQDIPRYVEGTLHKVNVTESDRPFVVNGKSDYKIVYSGGKLATKAASYIYRQVKAATGASLEISEASGEEWNNSKKLIVINDKDMFAAAGLTMPEDDLGLAGYYIKTVGNSVFLMTVDEYGCRQAALAFLRHTLGFDVISTDMTIYEKTGETMPNMDIIEKPDIAMSWHSYAIDPETEYGMGAEDQYLMPVNGHTQHNVFEMLPKSKHQSAHPGWYSVDGTQLCYTARGDEKELRAMQEETIKVLKETILANPDQRVVSVTQEDTPTECTCADCKELSSKYGTTAGSIIRFLNYVDTEIQKWIVEEELGRQVTIMFFAYNKSFSAPAKLNDEGEWEPIDETVVMNDTLGVYIAPIDEQYNKTFYHENNETTYNQIEAWKSVANKLYFWLYDTNFRAYMYPYDTWDIILENYRYMYTTGAVAARSQAQTDQGTGTTAFTEFKIYLLSKAPFDVNVNYNDLVDRFFKYYFDDAEQPMRQMFDELRAYMAWLSATYELPGTIYETIELQEYWPKRVLDHWIELIDEAYAKIEHYRDTDPEHFAVLERHIKLESLFPRYALIRLHKGSYSDATYGAMQRSFRDDITALGITRNVEHGSFEDIFATWDF